MWAPSPTEPLPRPDPADPLRAHAGLSYAHQHWALPDSPLADSPLADSPPADSPPARATGLRGRLRALVAAQVFGSLNSYLRQERELIGNLVRLNDSMAQRCDDLTEEVEALRAELDRRAVVRANDDAQIAGMLDNLRRRTGYDPEDA